MHFPRMVISYVHQHQTNPHKRCDSTAYQMWETQSGRLPISQQFSLWRLLSYLPWLSDPGQRHLAQITRIRFSLTGTWDLSKEVQTETSVEQNYLSGSSRDSQGWDPQNFPLEILIVWQLLWFCVFLISLRKLARVAFRVAVKEP